jgi:hypothetical protein
MSVKIKDLFTEQNIKNVNVTFDYKGFDISVSNLGICQTPVLVFTRYNEEVKTVEPLHTVEAAILLVERLLSDNTHDYK